MSDKIWNVAAENRAMASTFAALGGLWTSYQLYKVLSFSYLHFVRPSALKRFKKNKPGSTSSSSWALITGASDGIGRGFAEELCNRGFNVVLHGRNEKKLNGVKDDLLKQWPDREIRLLIIDAGAEPFDLAGIEAAPEQLKDLNLRILINNVGGSGGAKPIFKPLAECGSDRSRLFLDINARFTTEITRILLPLLYKNGPAVVLNVGSFVCDIAAPYLSLYSGAKAYGKAWSRSLDLEMRAEGHDVEVIHVNVGEVSTAALQRPTSFFVPSARRMAKDSLDKIGCGEPLVFGYWPHYLHYLAMSITPRWIAEWLVLRIAKELQADELKEIQFCEKTTKGEEDIVPSLARPEKS